MMSTRITHVRGAAASAGRSSSASRIITRAAAPQGERQSRRDVLKSTVSLGAALALGFGAAVKPVEAKPVEIVSGKKSGLDMKQNILDEVRDLDLPVAQRNGLTQIRASKEDTLARVVESKKRIENDVTTYVNKAFWQDGKQELRRQVGNLSLDMNTLISASGDKKNGAALKKSFFTSVDALDFAIRKKDKETAQKYTAEAITKLNDFISFVS